MAETGVCGREKSGTPVTIQDPVQQSSTEAMFCPYYEGSKTAFVTRLGPFGTID